MDRNNYACFRARDPTVLSPELTQFGVVYIEEAVDIFSDSLDAPDYPVAVLINGTYKVEFIVSINSACNNLSQNHKKKYNRSFLLLIAAQSLRSRHSVTSRGRDVHQSAPVDDRNTLVGFEL